MVKILKVGIDYFPLYVSFLSSKLTRRAMKREGDGALAVLIAILSEIYSEKGYYVKVDDMFYDDISANLYTTKNATVHRVVQLAVEYGIFDAEMFKKFNILTSLEIQNTYRHCTRRRNSVMMIPEYLLEGNGLEVDIQRDGCFYDEDDVYIEPHSTGSDVDNCDQNVTFIPQSKAKQSKNTPSIPLKGEMKEEENNLFSGGDAAPSVSKCKRKRKEWTYEMIWELQSPADSVQRNFDGLRHDLNQFKIDPTQQYAIICKSNYGQIGHPVWKALSEMRNYGSKIKMPGKYLLSRIV